MRARLGRLVAASLLAVGLVAFGEIAAGASSAAERTADRAAEHATTTFSTVDVIVDTNGAPLGAYQVDLRFDDDRVRLVGIEAGAGFDEPPAYDPRALRSGRVVLAGLRVDAPHERGRVHVAVLHVEHPVPLTPRLRAVDLRVADDEGRRVPATLDSQLREEIR